VIVYRDDGGAAIDPRLLLDGCRAQARALMGAAGPSSHDDITSLLIDLGVVEAGVADAIFPEADGRSPVADSFRGASLAAGRLFHDSWRGASSSGLRGGAGALAALLDEVGRGPLPATVRPKVPEGYAYYALYPETYLAAAERWARDKGGGRAVVVIGVRSIGTSLAAVVAAALESEGVPVSSLTLRPRGHPFDRRPVLTPDLAAGLRARAGDSHFLVVDEGPGLSASSLTGTADVLGALGVPDRRVTLFPSHLPDPAGFVSESARERWPRHGKAHAPFETVFPAGTPWGAEARDLSAGGWRGLLYADERAWPAVHPWHERRKYLAEAGDGTAVLHRFAGLGGHGARACRRATALAEAGLTPPVLGLSRGFLGQAWVGGARPLTRRDAGPAFLAFAATYLGHLGRHHATGEAANNRQLIEMLRVNVLEELGASWPNSINGLKRHNTSMSEVLAVAVDGRMLPHEWLLTPTGTYLKTDAIDHHADHFFPGPAADIAWDIAGLAAEFGLPDRTVANLAAAVGAAVGDPALAARLPFHAAAYTAFRLGYVRLAAVTLAGTADGARMGRLARRYRRQLERAVERLSAVL
jgi:hypothetical protein